MTIRTQVITPLVDSAPGETVDILIDIFNDADQPATVVAAPVGLEAGLDAGWSQQTFEIPPASQIRAAVSFPVPTTLGIGQHASGIQLMEAGASRPLLVNFTVSIASLQRVLLRATPVQVRGIRSAKFALDIVNNEMHPVAVMLTSEDRSAKVKYRQTSFALAPGERASTRGKVRLPLRMSGEAAQHNVQLVAHSKAARTTLRLPFIQRSFLPYRIRTLVAEVATVAVRRRPVLQ